uniref:TFIIS N-terminal domain-containing protein n=1 Tax=Chlamydomonas leiostraca TaxID=1034604 RepID=A0A7S0RNL4_9CHLO|mmetsp:Transcript_27709/g.70609  ORF Transcript_27709/g.70609 Transcript_27709/m.70609 type:complete len:216 (+) Transcript_27709:64-711(+)
MDKYVEQWRTGNVTTNKENNSNRRTGTTMARQMRIEDCKKVQRLEASYIAPTPEILEDIRRGLEAATTHYDVEEQLTQLRKLGCYELTYDILVTTQIGLAVRPMRNSPHPDVARLATNILEKLKEVVRRKARMTTGDPLQPSTTSASTSHQAPSASAYSAGTTQSASVSTVGTASRSTASGSIAAGGGGSKAGVKRPPPPAAWQTSSDGWMSRKR